MLDLTEAQWISAIAVAVVVIGTPLAIWLRGH